MHDNDGPQEPKGGLRGFWKRLLYIAAYGGFVLRSGRRDRALKALGIGRWEELPGAALDELADLHTRRAAHLAAMGGIFAPERVGHLCGVCRGGCCATGSQSRFGLADYYLVGRPNVELEEVTAAASHSTPVLASVGSLMGQVGRGVVRALLGRPGHKRAPEDKGDGLPCREFPHVLGIKSPNWDHADTRPCPWLGPQGCRLPREDFPTRCSIWLCNWMCDVLTLDEMRSLVRRARESERFDDQVVACLRRHTGKAAS